VVEPQERSRRIGIFKPDPQRPVAQAHRGAGLFEAKGIAEAPRGPLVPVVLKLDWYVLNRGESAGAEK
jgi:hypothetical protein